MKSISEVINEMQGFNTVYAVTGGFFGPDGAAGSQRTFAEVPYVCDKSLVAEKVGEELEDDHEYDYCRFQAVTYFGGVLKVSKPFVVVGYSNKYQGFVKVLAVLDNNKAAQKWIANLSNEEKLNIKKQFNIDSYEILPSERC